MNTREHVVIDITEEIWRIGNTEISVAFTFSAEQGLVMKSLRNERSGFELLAEGRASAPGSFVPAGGKPSAQFGNGTASSTELDNGGNELRMRYAQLSTGLVLSVAVSCYPDHPVLALRCTTANGGTGDFVFEEALPPVSITLNGDPELIRGNEVNLSPLGENPENDSWVATRWDDHDETLLIEADEPCAVYRWDVTADRKDGLLILEGKDGRERGMALEPGAEIDFPEVFLTACSGDLDDACNSFRRFIQAHVFPSYPDGFPWQVYGAWFTDTEAEKLLFEELELTRSMGFDCFVHDAGWNEGSSTVPGMNDWTAGLGSYKMNLDIFPNGLKPVADATHRMGLKFGIWVDPVNVDSKRVESGEIPRDFVASIDGKELICRHPSLSPTSQLCLGNPEVVDWLKNELEELIRGLDVDWVKWDPSCTVSNECNRGDHGHRAENGRYATYRGYVEIWGHLLETFPDLVGFECQPSFRHARVNPGSSYLFPGSANKFTVGPMVLPYVMGSLAHQHSMYGAFKMIPGAAYSASFLDYHFRNLFLQSAFIFGTVNGMDSQRLSLAPRGYLEAYKRSILQFKDYRHLLARDRYILAPSAGEGWRAVEYVSRDAGNAVVFVFRDGSPDGSASIRLRGLDPSANYRVDSLNQRPGRETVMTGADLMERGIETVLPDRWLSCGDLDLNTLGEKEREEFEKQFRFGSDILLFAQTDR